MRRFILFSVTLVLLSFKTAFNQQVFKLTIKQPPPLTITMADSINFTEGEVINLDNLFYVDGAFSFIREWKFHDGVQLQTIGNPVLTVYNSRVYYLTVIDKNGCTAVDSIVINLVTGIEDNFAKRNNPQAIYIYPNPNSGTFDILIHECLPGYSIQVINSLGVQLLNRYLDCNHNEYRGTITLPSRKPGIYFLLVKKDREAIYRQKVIIFN